jgi:hypothetical protein
VAGKDSIAILSVYVNYYFKINKQIKVITYFFWQSIAMDALMVTYGGKGSNDRQQKGG